MKLTGAQSSNGLHRLDNMTGYPTSSPTNGCQCDMSFCVYFQGKRTRYHESQQHVKHNHAYRHQHSRKQYHSIICLTHLPLDKMASISQMTSSNTFSWMKSFVLRFSLKFVSKGPIDKKLLLGQVMAWCRTGDKPLPEARLIRFTGTWVNWDIMMMAHTAPLNLTINGAILFVGNVDTDDLVLKHRVISIHSPDYILIYWTSSMQKYYTHRE